MKEAWLGIAWVKVAKMHIIYMSGNMIFIQYMNICIYLVNINIVHIYVE